MRKPHASRKVAAMLAVLITASAALWGTAAALDGDMSDESFILLTGAAIACTVSTVLAAVTLVSRDREKDELLDRAFIASRRVARAATGPHRHLRPAPESRPGTQGLPAPTDPFHQRASG
jgi:hypothetical protein